LLGCQQQHWNQMNFRTYAFFEWVSEERRADNSVGNISYINHKMFMTDWIE
jgi:hypothetical protein